MFNYKYFIYSFLLFALSYGQSLQDLKKIQNEYEKFKKERRSGSELINENSLNGIDDNLPKNIKLANPRIDNLYPDSLAQKLRYYGYDFFTARDSLAFWENLPAPRDYLLGPGDELIISIWGETQLRQKYTISRNGSIYDEKVGLLFFSGKTIEDSEEYLNKQFSRVYSTLNKPNPSSYIDISIGKTKSINVNFSGEVFLPGIHPIHPFSNIITGLIQAGGVDTTGSLRNIKLRRNGNDYATFDFYDYLISGKIPKNIQLRDQDIVFIPIRNSTVVLDSAVMRPGIYESKSGETVKTMINYAGGTKANASKKISLQRITPIEKRIGETFSNYESYYLDYQNAKSSLVQDGDIITLKTMPKTLKQVEIIGINPNPDIYHFYKGIKVKDLLDLSGIFNDTLAWNIYINKAEIIRKDPNRRYEKVIPIKLNEITNENNIELNNLDRLVLHRNQNYKERKNVKIYGEVNIPGSYPLIKDGETLKSLIERSGSFTSKALDEGIVIYRTKEHYKQEIISEIPAKPLLKPTNQINNNADQKYYEFLNEKLNKDKNRIRVAWSNYNLPLMPGDSVIVKESTATVLVDGEVYNPGLIEYTKGKNLKYYIDSAGGVNINGDKKNIVVIYANGAIKPNKPILSPIIKDGTTIYVNKKEIKEGIDLSTISTFLSIVSTTITTIILVQQLSAN